MCRGDIICIPSQLNTAQEDIFFHMDPTSLLFNEIGSDLFFSLFIFISI